MVVADPLCALASSLVRYFALLVCATMAQVVRRMDCVTAARRLECLLIDPRHLRGILWHGEHCRRGWIWGRIGREVRRRSRGNETFASTLKGYTADTSVPNTTGPLPQD